ncbi:hypothetical protein LQG66_05970 [Bradyrhizobium ontarionense]|uniref:PNPLA domain-containing protein n=1 Tax=Bradyrhizobium ontarionense TaxID=2898149 RepID=A0ABY3RGL3_9BRAD|nr:patatin-like phospholipase family protein [Bradyrhizobium sp. A19]UFZ05853.1 hypothetical protein LQG66_05970 [Bradyrhizobium sp. A19]
MASWIELLEAVDRAAQGEPHLFAASPPLARARAAPSPTDEDRTAAGRLHIQCVSRIVTQRLPYADGEEVAALASVYQLFKEARTIFDAHPQCGLLNDLVWHVLNTRVRPFTAKWHRLSERGALAALDATDVFRDDLARLQPILARLDALLVAIRDGTPYAPPGADPANSNEADITAEMGGSLPWGIDDKLGGLDARMAADINRQERDAIALRRAVYADRLRADGRTATQDDWTARPHAAALAISGGGIRSATFALGVLVALARRNLLFQFDYLSTVSGGGYIGSFLTTFLSGPAPDGASLGLMRSDLPFQREDGEAAALRHVRHHSKYLATGGLAERLRMAFAQVYGMAMNGLGIVYLATIAALVEYVLRLVLPPESFWPIPLLVAGVALLATPFVLPQLARRRNHRSAADGLLLALCIIPIALLAWQGLGWLHVNVEWQPLYLLIPLVPLLASALLALAGRVALPLRIPLMVASSVAVPLIFIGTELIVYHHIRDESVLPVLGSTSNIFIAMVLAVVGFWLLCDLFDINFTAPHRHYKKKLGEAYLVQPDSAEPLGPLRENVSVALSACNDAGRGPYHLVNCALNVPASKQARMQGRLTDFFLFSRAFCGSPLTGYQPTQAWERLDDDLDLGTAMAISGAAAAAQMGTGTIRTLSFWLALFNIRLGYWIRNPGHARAGDVGPPGLSYLLQEMCGLADESRPHVNVSDGGHIENLGVYELLRRRCKYIVAIDGEQDAQMTFHGLTTLQRLAAIDLGITIDIGLDQLRPSKTSGLSHSHFAFCRIHYPRTTRDDGESHGYLIYLKLSLTGNEGEFIRRYRLDEPNFPHHSTANQFFTEAQFEAYRSLGEHVGDKLFLPAIVGPDMSQHSADVRVEEWFLAIGKNMLSPLR